MARQKAELVGFWRSAAVDLGVSVLVLVPLSSSFHLGGATGASLPVSSRATQTAWQHCRVSVVYMFQFLFVSAKRSPLDRPLSDNAIIPDSKLDNEVHQQ